MIVHILSLNDDDDDAKALPTGVLKDDAMKKGGWGGQNVSKSDGVILVCSLIVKTDGLFAALVPTLPGGVVCGQLGGLSGWLPDPEQTL